MQHSQKFQGLKRKMKDCPMPRGNAGIFFHLKIGMFRIFDVKDSRSDVFFLQNFWKFDNTKRNV